MVVTALMIMKLQTIQYITNFKNVKIPSIFLKIIFLMEPSLKIILASITLNYLGKQTPKDDRICLSESNFAIHKNFLKAKLV